MNGLIKLPLAVVFQPRETFRLIRGYRNRFTFLPVLMLFTLAISVRVGYIYLIHFPLAVLEPKDANILLEMVKIFVPLLTWVVSSYAVTSILDGEAEMREMLMASAFALVPYILLALPLAGISQLLGSVKAEKNMFVFLNRAVLGWVLLLLVLGVKNLNDYSVGKTIAVCLLSVFGVALIWALFVLVFALTGNLKAFVQGLAIETWMTIRFR